MKSSWLRNTLAIYLLGSLAGMAFAQEEEPPCTEDCETPPIQWEHIHADFRNLRGVNYIPVYSHLVEIGASGGVVLAIDPSSNPPAPYQPDFKGDTTGIALWRFYDMDMAGTAGDVSTQIDLLKGMGINILRVWLSFPVWEHHDLNPVPGQENLFIQKWKHFLTICEGKQMRVQPILWDGQGVDPEYGTAHLGPGNVAPNWRANPGFARIYSLTLTADPQVIFEMGRKVPVAGGDYVHPESRYIRDVVVASWNRPAVFMWDIMNEPRWTKQDQTVDQDVLQFIKQSLELVANIDINQRPRTVGAAGWLANEVGTEAVSPFDIDQDDIAQHARLDVLSVHPYGHTRIVLETMIHEAILAQGAQTPRPMIASEVGGSGNCSPYREAIDYMVNVPRADMPPLLGTSTLRKGMGFMAYQGMVGFGAHIHALATGIIYPEGTVRDVADAEAFKTLALAQGVPATQLAAQFYPVVQDDMVTLGYRDTAPLPLGYGYQDILTALGTDYDAWSTAAAAYLAVPPPPGAAAGLAAWEESIDFHMTLYAVVRQFSIDFPSLTKNGTTHPYAQFNGFPLLPGTCERVRFTQVNERYFLDSYAWFDAFDCPTTGPFAGQVIAVLDPDRVPPPGTDFPNTSPPVASQGLRIETGYDILDRIADLKLMRDTMETFVTQQDPSTPVGPYTSL